MRGARFARHAACLTMLLVWACQDEPEEPERMALQAPPDPSVPGVHAEPTEPTATGEAAPADPPETPEEASGSDSNRSLTQLVVTLDEGEPRETMERVAESVGATITTAAVEFGIYSVRIDVDSAEVRDAIIAQIAAEDGVREARADRQSFRVPRPGGE